MVFTKRLREGIRRRRIKCTVRIWMSPHVRAGGRYRMDEGHIVVDSIVPIRMADITRDLARESGFSSVKELLQIAQHGRGENVYLIRFHYLPPGGWDVQRTAAENRSGPESSSSRSTMLHRIRRSAPPGLSVTAKGGPTTNKRRRRGR